VRAIGLSGSWDADPGWRAAFRVVPRHLLSCRIYYVGVEGGYERLWGRSPEPVRPGRWLRGVYADVPLAHAVADGELVSSSSQPSLMARMAELRVADGDRLLEIGAGRATHAALLAHRLGDGLVNHRRSGTGRSQSQPAPTSPPAGHHPTVVTGDGTRGVPEHGPYDRNHREPAP